MAEADLDREIEAANEEELRKILREIRKDLNDEEKIQFSKGFLKLAVELDPIASSLPRPQRLAVASDAIKNAYINLYGMTVGEILAAGEVNKTNAADLECLKEGIELSQTSYDTYKITNKFDAVLISLTIWVQYKSTDRPLPLQTEKSCILEPSGGWGPYDTRKFDNPCQINVRDLASEAEVSYSTINSTTKIVGAQFLGNSTICNLALAPEQKLPEKTIEQKLEQELRKLEQERRTVSSIINAQLARCWREPNGAPDPSRLAVVVSFSLNRDGRLVGRPQIVDGPPSSEPFADQVRRNAILAVEKCSPLKDLPAELYNEWRRVEVKFGPRMGR